MPIPTRYTATAIALHWLMAALILVLWGVGLTLEDLPKGEVASTVIGLHKAFGVVVLALVVIRLAWRASHPAPELPGTMPLWEQRVARLGHLALYLLMMAVPMAGILLSQTGGHPVSVFGATLPTLLDKNTFWHEVFDNLHGPLAWTLVTVAGLHAMAALRHHFLLKDDVLRRMLPRRA